MTKTRNKIRRSACDRPALGRFLFVLLAIEFLDEFVYGAREAAWPLIRDDLALSYAQIGILLGLPGILGAVVEPFLGVLGDLWQRRALIVGGGVVFAASLLITGVSHSFALLLLSFVLFSPASGAFVSLSQASLMDLDPERRDHNMARWTFAGSVGVVLGPLVLGGAAAWHLGWRGLFLAFGVLSALAVALAWRMPYDRHKQDEEPLSARLFAASLLDALRAMRQGPVLRWLVLLQFSDLLLDVFLGFLALYMVDVVGTTPARAGLAVAVWTGAGLLSDFLLIPVLERVKGLHYLRASVVVGLLLYPTFLLARPAWAKLALLAALGLCNAGWYAIPKARLYDALPGKSGTVMAVSSLASLAGSLTPAALGFIAQRWGLPVSMWLLLLGPAALLVGLPRDEAKAQQISN